MVADWDCPPTTKKRFPTIAAATSRRPVIGAPDGSFVTGIPGTGSLCGSQEDVVVQLKVLGSSVLKEGTVSETATPWVSPSGSPRSLGTPPERPTVRQPRTTTSYG